MSLLYNVAYRKDMKDAKLPKLYYIVLKNRGILPENEFSQQLSLLAGIPALACNAVVKALAQVTLNNLRDGHSIELPDLGHFYLTANSTGVEKKEDISANQLKQINIRFTPKETISQMVNKTTLTRAASLVNENDIPAESEEEGEDPTT